MRRILLPAALAALAVAAPAAAHHSAAMFDATKLVVLKGTVISFAYINPHSWISVQGAPEGGGKAERWDIEAVAPPILARMGMNAQTLKPGDKVTAALRPLRDGRHAGSMVYVITAEGKVFGADPKQVEAFKNAP